MGDARSVKLLQKVNPMLTLGCTTTHMVYGQLGTPATIPTDLLFGDVRREKPKLSLKPMQKPKLTICRTEYGQLGTLDTIVSTDGNGVTLLVNYSLSHQVMRIPKFNAIYFSNQRTLKHSIGSTFKIRNQVT